MTFRTLGVGSVYPTQRAHGETMSAAPTGRSVLLHPQGGLQDPGAF